jgi:hypothetical protein
MRDDEGDHQLAELLDGSFGAGPDGLPTPSERLAAGRQALRRRHRAAIAGTTAAVVAVVGLGVGLSGVGTERGADDGLAPLATSGSTASADPSEASEPPPETLTEALLEESLDKLARQAQQRAHRLEQRLVSDQFPASLDIQGQVVVKDGWRITQRVEEPLGYQPPEASLGVVATDGDHTRWLLITLTRQLDGEGNQTAELSQSISADDPGKGYSRFEDWLDSMVELNGGARTPPLVTVDSADRLQPGPGAALVETRPAPVIDDYTAEGDRLVEVLREGRTWFVVVRGHGPEAEVIPVDADVLSAPTFDSLIEHLTSQADSGEGVR